MISIREIFQKQCDIVSDKVHYTTKRYCGTKESSAIPRFSIFFVIINSFSPLRGGKRVEITFFCEYRDYIEMKNHSARFESHEWHRRFLFEVQNLWSNLKRKRSQNV